LSDYQSMVLIIVWIYYSIIYKGLSFREFLTLTKQHLKKKIHIQLCEPAMFNSVNMQLIPCS